MLYTVKQVELAVRSHLDDLLKPAGITAPQYTALTVLDRGDGISLTELAHNSFVRVQSMADLLRPPYARELVRRRPDPAHGPRQLINLTSAGQELLDQYSDRVQALEQAMLAPLADGEADLQRSMLPHRPRLTIAGWEPASALTTWSDPTWGYLSDEAARVRKAEAGVARRAFGQR